VFSVSVLIALQSASIAQTTAPDPLAGMDCSRFERVTQDGGEAITVDAVIDGRKKTLQLDTGAAASELGDVSATGLTGTSVKTGKTELGPLWFMKQNTDGNTLGLDALIGQVVAIDYPRSRICFSKPANFPFAIYSATHWSPAVIREGHLWVPVKIGPKEYRNFFFDTGSSLLPLFTDASLWRTFTGLTGPKAAHHVLSGNSWGESMKLVGSEIKAKVRIGDVEVGSPVAYFQPAKPTTFATDQSGADGLFGNALVSDHIVLLYLSSRPLFGLLGTGTASADNK
jgi:hypothetical protein